MKIKITYNVSPAFFRHHQVELQFNRKDEGIYTEKMVIGVGGSVPQEVKLSSPGHSVRCFKQF